MSVDKEWAFRPLTWPARSEYQVVTEVSAFAAPNVFAPSRKVSRHLAALGE